jgi:hypothetical protein
MVPQEQTKLSRVSFYRIIFCLSLEFLFYFISGFFPFFLKKKNFFIYLVVSKAFQVLSDPQKRAAFDENGIDPDSRNTGMPSGFGGGRFNGGFANGAVFADDISPEEIFNMFFNTDSSGIYNLILYSQKKFSLKKY